MEIIIAILVLVAIVAGLLFVNKRSASKREGGGGATAPRENVKPNKPKDKKNKQQN